MATIVSHGVAALAVAACFYRPEIPGRVWAVGVLSSILPDLDVVGFRLGIRYGDLLGHRGLSHSLCFAALWSALLVLAAFRRGVPAIRPPVLWAFLFLATASHGLLDALTDGGLGVAFFSPFLTARYFFPWRPVRVSPIGVAWFFTGQGTAILGNELWWIWLPSALLAALAWFLGRSARRRPAA